MEYSKGDSLYFVSDNDSKYFSDEEIFPGNPRMTREMIDLIRKAKKIVIQDILQSKFRVLLRVDNRPTHYSWDTRWFKRSPLEADFKYVDENII